MKLAPFRLQLLEALKGSSYFDTETKAKADATNADICIRGSSSGSRFKVNYQTSLTKTPVIPPSFTFFKPRESLLQMDSTNHVYVVSDFYLTSW